MAGDYTSQKRQIWRFGWEFSVMRTLHLKQTTLCPTGIGKVTENHPLYSIENTRQNTGGLLWAIVNTARRHSRLPVWGPPTCTIISYISIVSLFWNSIYFMLLKTHSVMESINFIRLQDKSKAQKSLKMPGNFWEELSKHWRQVETSCNPY